MVLVTFIIILNKYYNYCFELGELGACPEFPHPVTSKSSIWDKTVKDVWELKFFKLKVPITHLHKITPVEALYASNGSLWGLLRGLQRKLGTAQPSSWGSHHAFSMFRWLWLLFPLGKSLQIWRCLRSEWRACLRPRIASHAEVDASALECRAWCLRTTPPPLDRSRGAIQDRCPRWFRETSCQCSIDPSPCSKQAWKGWSWAPSCCKAWSALESIGLARRGIPRLLDWRKSCYRNCGLRRWLPATAISR